MTKQQIIENKLDKNGETTMGCELNALIALNARQSMSQGKATEFIQEFSESLGFKKHLDTAYHIMNELYPKNPTYWEITDKMYFKKVKRSAWFKANNH